MKKLCIFFVLFLLGFFFLSAQDLITLSNGEIIEARVLEISPAEIRYKRFDHLDGPTIVVLANDVNSIKYENGRTDIINTSAQNNTSGQNTAVNEVIDRRKRLNTIGASFGYQGVSALGLSLIGTVSPANYTFFDFNLGLGFNDFSFNGKIGFNGLVPFDKGGWYAGIGGGGGYNEIQEGIIFGSITTGFIFFNWFNIGYSLQIGSFDDVINHNVFAGYLYRFNSPENTVTDTEVTEVSKPKKPPRELRHKILFEPNLYIYGNTEFLRVYGIYNSSRYGYGIDVKYLYQITPIFDIGGSFHYGVLERPENEPYDPFVFSSGSDFNMLTNGYFYFSAKRRGFLKLGLGWSYIDLGEFSHNNSQINNYYNVDNYPFKGTGTFSGFILVPGFGWIIDGGKPGGLVIPIGLDIPIINGTYREGNSNYKDEGTMWGFRIFLGIGYAF